MPISTASGSFASTAARRPLRGRRGRGRGEGSLAGPLVVAGVLLDYERLRDHRVRPLASLNDSKQVSPEQRQQLFHAVVGARRRSRCGSSARARSTRTASTGPISPGCARRSPLCAAGGGLPRRRLPARPDGARPPGVVDGDTKSAAIAAASIIAKVVRDRTMRRMDALFPHYGFSSHVGYITPRHSAAVRARGLSTSIACRSRRSATRTLARRGSGRRAERRALWHYRLRAYRILGENVWLAGGELDLIVRRGAARLRRGQVEVRARASGRRGDGRRRKQRRLVRAAERGWRATRSAGVSTSRSRWLRSTRARSACAARRSGLRAEHVGGSWPDAGRPLRPDRPRALLVGAGAPRARADEARPPAPPVPRQVHPAARRGAPRPLRPRGRSRARPVRRLGTTLVQALESGYDATGVDIAAFNCAADAREDERVQPVHARARAARRRAPRRRETERRSRGLTVRPPLVRAAGGRRAARFSFAHRRTTSTRRPRVVLARAARSARRTTHFDLDFPAHPSASRTGATSTSASADPSSARRTSCAGTRSTPRAREGVRPGPRAGRPRACSTVMRGRSISAGRTTRWSPRRRTRA